MLKNLKNKLQNKLNNASASQTSNSNMNDALPTKHNLNNTLLQNIKNSKLYLSLTKKLSFQKATNLIQQSLIVSNNRNTHDISDDDMDEPDFGGSKKKFNNVSEKNKSNNSKAPHYESPTPERLSMSQTDKDKDNNSNKPDKLLENILSNNKTVNNKSNSDNSSVADSGIHHNNQEDDDAMLTDKNDDGDIANNYNDKDDKDDNSQNDEFIDEDDLGFNYISVSPEKARMASEKLANEYN